jgi:hypothetical protein
MLQVEMRPVTGDALRAVKGAVVFDSSLREAAVKD